MASLLQGLKEREFVQWVLAYLVATLAAFFGVFSTLILALSHRETPTLPVLGPEDEVMIQRSYHGNWNARLLVGADMLPVVAAAALQGQWQPHAGVARPTTSGGCHCPDIRRAGTPPSSLRPGTLEELVHRADEPVDALVAGPRTHQADPP